MKKARFVSLATLLLVSGLSFSFQAKADVSIEQLKLVSEKSAVPGNGEKSELRLDEVFAHAGLPPDSNEVIEDSDIPNQTVPGTYPNQYTSSSYPNQYTASSYPNQYTATSYPNQYTSTSYPNQYTSTSYPNQYTSTSYPNQYTATSYPNQYTSTSYPSQYTAGHAPDGIEKLDVQGARYNQLPMPQMDIAQ